MHEGNIFTAIFIGIEYSREYREAYGVSRSERLLLFVARILEESLSGQSDCYLGQPAYEEFIVLCEAGKGAALGKQLIERFEHEKAELYMEQHRHCGELTYYDYRGEVIHCPFVNLALGGICNAKRFVATYNAIAEWGAQVLLKARARGESACIIED